MAKNRETCHKGKVISYHAVSEEWFLLSSLVLPPLEQLIEKEQILEFYLNNIYFGNGYYGVEAAAKGYFNKSVSQLTLSEQAFIAAIPNNPSKYNPLTGFDKTLKRRDLTADV